MRNRLANLVLSLVIAALAAVGAVWWSTESREQAVADASQVRGGPSAPGDRVGAAIRELRKDGVHVAPDGRHLIDKLDEAALERAVAGLAVPVRVIFWRETKGSGAYLDADRQLQAAFSDERSVILVWEGPGGGDAVITGGDGHAIVSGDFVGDPVTTITDSLDEIQQSAHWYEDREQDSDYWGGIAGGIAAGLLFASVALLGLGLLLWFVRSVSGGILRLPGRW